MNKNIIQPPTPPPPSAPTRRRCARRHRLPLRPDRPRSGNHATGRGHRGADPSRLREPGGGRAGRRRGLSDRRGAHDRLPHRPRALRQGERNHGEVLQPALSGARADRRGSAAARRAGRDRRVMFVGNAKVDKQASPFLAGQPRARGQARQARPRARRRPACCTCRMRYEDETRLTPIARRAAGRRRRRSRPRC